MKYLLLGITLFLFFLSSVNQVFAGDVIINEIMYDLSGSDTDREWIELYNKSSSSVDLSNWRLQEGGTKHLLSSYQGGSILNPDSYGVIVDNPSVFLGDHSGFSGIIIDSSFSLSNTGETLILLETTDGPISDEIIYQSSWGAAGNGSSLERKSAAGSSNDSSNWQESPAGGTPGSQNSSGVTPTPTPTIVPTSTPTTAPTATKTPTATPVKTPTPTPKSSSSGGSGATATPKPTVSPTPAPTKVLALSSQAAGGSGNINTAVSPTANLSPTPTKEPTKKPTPTVTTAILGVAQNNLSKILIGVGVLFLLACGILAFRNFKREKIS